MHVNLPAVFRSFALVMCVLVVPVCTLPEAGGGAVDPGDEGNEVVYRLEWDLEGADPHPEGGWILAQPDGTEVWLERGWLTSYSAELLACPSEAEAERQIRSGWAFAGHGSGPPGSSAVTQARVEALHSPESVEFGAPLVESGRWCQLHYLIAATPWNALGLSEDGLMVDRTLRLEGTWFGVEESLPFVIETDLASGTIAALHPEGMIGVEAAALTLDTSVEGGTMRVTRRLATIFNDVDFETMGDVDRAKAVLSRVMKDVSVELLPGEYLHEEFSP